MVRLSLLDKINRIISIIKDSNEAKYLLPIMVLIIGIMIFAFVKKNKVLKITYLIIYFGALLTLAWFYHNTILELCDYLVENIVNNLLFPNLAVYIAILIIVNIIVIGSIISKKTKTYIKSINITFFIIMQTIVFFIAKNIITNGINVYETLTVYTNEELLVLIDFSTTIFIIWLLVLGIVKLINFLIDNRTQTKEIKEVIPETENINNQIVIENEEPVFIEYVPIKKKKSLIEN